MYLSYVALPFFAQRPLISSGRHRGPTSSSVSENVYCLLCQDYGSMISFTLKSVV